MTDQQAESIEFDGIKVPIIRQVNEEMYIALQPPEALPYLVVPADKKPEEIINFVQYWIENIRDARTDMLKRFEKSKSLKCHYQTGDVVYLLGRPFMLRTYPLTTTKMKGKSTRGRSKVKATIHGEISVIDLFLVQLGNYDQGRLAFMAFATPLLTQNAPSLVKQCMERVFPDKAIPTKINCRPMHDRWVQYDQKRDTLWVSEKLIPYPPECLVYAYLVEMIKVFVPDASEEERHALMENGIPGWRHWGEILADPNSPYSNQ